MKIGIFDSGLGGLIVTKTIRKLMPEYDYVYLGDTKRVPYGNRSYETVYEFTCRGIDYLFKKENCEIVIIACNTASARALRRIQQEYLPANYPNKKVLGVLIPTAEECAKFGKVGIIATRGTVASNTFVDEIKKINTKTKVFQNSAPMLVPLAEEGDKVFAKPFIKKYLKPFLSKKLDAVVLGCTHYPFFKAEIRKVLPKNIKILSQDEFIPKKLKDYFARHPEVETKLGKNRTAKVLVTDITHNVVKLTQKWFGHAKGRAGKETKPELVKI